MFDFVNSLSRYVMGFTSNSLPSQIKTGKFRQKRILIQDKLIYISTIVKHLVIMSFASFTFSKWSLNLAYPTTLSELFLSHRKNSL